MMAYILNASFDSDPGATCAAEATYINVRDAESRFVGEGRENLLGRSPL